MTHPVSSLVSHKNHTHSPVTVIGFQFIQMLAAFTVVFGFSRVHSQCEEYEGMACSRYIQGFKIFRNSSLGDQDAIETAIRKFIVSLNSGSSSDTCREFVIDMLCHHAFPYCYPNDSKSTGPRPVCLQDCLIAKNELCASYWPEIIAGSRDYFQLYVDNETEAMSLFTQCYGFDATKGGEEPECFTSVWKNQASYSDNKLSDNCIVGVGQGYTGNVSVTVSGRSCQSWYSQWPHAHPFNVSLNSELQVAKNSCRNPGGRAGGPWCYTTDPAVRWEICDIPRCDSNTECQTSIFRTLGICEKFGIFSYTTLFINTSLVASQEKLASSLLSTSDVLDQFTLTWQCRAAIHPFLCHIAFPLCDWSTSEPRQRQICREYCNYVRLQECPDVWNELDKQLLARESVWPLHLPTCEGLPSQYDADPPDCIVQPYNGLLEATTFNTDCFTEIAADYIGNVSVTESGRACQSWQSRYPHNHTDDLSTLPYEARGNHNYCRNPEGRRHKPWCYTTDPAARWEYCNIPKCPAKSPDHKRVVIASVVGGTLFLLIGIVIVVSCIFNKRSEGNCCVVGRGEALTENDFLGQVLRPDQELNNEMTTVGSREDRGGSQANSDQTNADTNHTQHHVSEAPESVSRMTVEVEIHGNGSTVHNGN